MLCEICGEKRAVTKIKTDGLFFSVCENCTKLGREVSIPKPIVTRKSQVQYKTQYTPQFTKQSKREEDIFPDYAKRIKDAMMKKGLTTKELAIKISEKLNIVERVVKGKLTPDNKIKKKLEKTLEIQLSGIISTGQSFSKNLPNATLGDLAEVKFVSRSKH